MSAILFSILVKCAWALPAFAAHEAGHTAVALFFGARIKKIGIRPRGVYIQRTRSEGWREAAICLAGPGANLILALAFWRIAPWFAVCNLIFTAINLLPVAHSDGTHAIDTMTAFYEHRLDATKE